ncbi:hypothetical protein BC831DRAFT_456423 [Entophlyctis helioformis]|nr:hypothetical protein BC831DRAFT_456423 [Entophlyctis helioformis]
MGQLKIGGQPPNAADAAKKPPMTAAKKAWDSAAPSTGNPRVDAQIVNGAVDPQQSQQQQQQRRPRQNNNNNNNNNQQQQPSGEQQQQQRSYDGRGTRGRGGNRGAFNADGSRRHVANHTENGPSDQQHQNQHQPRPQRIVVPDTEYDFESANAKFNKSEVVPREDHSPTEEVYYTKSSFFDNISCDSRDRAEAGSIDRRARMTQDRRLNVETFGQSGPSRGGYNNRRFGGNGPREPQNNNLLTEDGAGRGGRGGGRGRGGRGGRGGNYYGNNPTNSGRGSFRHNNFNTNSTGSFQQGEQSVVPHA